MAKKKTGKKAGQEKPGSPQNPEETAPLGDILVEEAGIAKEGGSPGEASGPAAPIDIGDMVVEGETGDLGLDKVIGAGPAEEKDPVTQLTEERDELKDKLLRALADAENMRRRTEKETAQARKYGHSAFARDLLGVVDNLTRAVDALPEDRDGLDEAMRNLVVGVEMVAKELADVMGRHGITQINPMGEKFDYDRHQAMFEVPTDDAEPGVVVEVARPGWMLHDRLLSPAMVGVAKKPGDGDSAKKDT